MPNKLSRFWQELKRRRVIHVIVVYATAAFIIIELVNNVYEPLRLPDWTTLLVILILAIGFPVAIIISWIFDISFKGVKKTEPVQQNDVQSESTLLSEKPPVQEKSIIVLPFENISPDPDQEYFSDGLTEEIITDLSHINDLLVISRSSAMTFKGTKKKIGEIASDVNVRYVMEGSVRKAGNNLRITAQLIDAFTDTHIWAEKYSGTLDDVFDIQENVSRSIVNALRIKISAKEKGKIHERPIDNVLAYDCYKKAHAEIISFVKERMDYGLSLLQNGLDITGENALIYAGIALAYFQYTNLGLEQEKHIKKSEEFIKKALDIDPELAEAHYVYANILAWYKGKIHEAISHFKRALSNKPDHFETMMWLWWWYHIFGKTNAALAIGDRMIKINPIDLQTTISVGGLNHFMQGQFNLALDPILRVYRLQPESSMWQLWKSLALMYNDRASETYEFLNGTIKEPARDSITSLLVFLKYAIQGDKEKLTSLLTPDFVKPIQTDCQYSWHLAAFYAFINEKDQSLEWLENAVNRGFINYPFLANHDKLLNNIRSEERFKKLMERVKHEWENFEV